MDLWLLSDDEWHALEHLLVSEPVRPRGRGRPRIGDNRALAQACLFLSYHSLSRGRSHCFNWNLLPDAFGVSPSTANRRFREWNASGAWPEFWHALQELRLRRPHGPRARARPRAARKLGSNPVSDLLSELQRGYHFFNRVLFGGVLPEEVAIVVLPAGGHGRRLGFYCGRSWRWGRPQATDLIAVSGQAIGLGAAQAFETLIHEMTHYRNDRFGLVDCTSRGMYHNRHFRDNALLAGLVCGGHHQTLGYGVTSLGERGRWAVDRLRPNKELFGGGLPPQPKSPSS